MTRHRNLVSLKDGDSLIARELGARFAKAGSFSADDGADRGGTNRENILFVGSGALAAEDVNDHSLLQEALSRRIPIVLEKPSEDLLTGLTHMGLRARLAIVVKGTGSRYYMASFHDDSPNLSTSPWVESLPWKDEDLVQEAFRALEDLDSIDRRIESLSFESQGDEIPENRTWSTWVDTGWTSKTLSDPSGEQPEKKQTARFTVTFTANLIAADSPVKTKILDISVGGAGFEPLASGESLIRNDEKHRGWAQCMTYVSFEPKHELGPIEDYVPINTANTASVSTGFSWTLGFSAEGEGGPDGGSGGGSLSFSFTVDDSQTKQCLDFETLTESIGEWGMRFYHNAKIVGGDTEIDPRRFWLSDEDKQDEQKNLFFAHISPGNRVRGWPSLSLQLLKPDSECVWYSPHDHAASLPIHVEVFQGLGYAYTKDYKDYLHLAQITKYPSLTIDYGAVSYDDPEDT